MEQHGINQEEDEDLEEQKKRQEEIQNFLTTAMDEFNYDDQSTVNSSESVSVDDTYNNQSATMQKYKNASLDDQLKVLYEVRVKEVKSLTEQLEQLKAEIRKQKDSNGKTALLLEAEKDKAKISSQQAQVLLVNKTEEISKLKNEIDTLRATVVSLETTVKAVNDEYTLCKQSNNELIEQLSLMHNGLTTNTISDRQLQEQHHSEVSQLHHLLDSAHMKLHRKEREFKELEQKLKEAVNDKDVLMAEKSGVINQLTQNLESALDRCQEFSQIIDKISQENKTLKLSTTSDLTESIKTMGLADKTEIVKALQRQLEKSHVIQSEQETELESLRRTCDKLTKECNKYEINDERQKNELEMWKKKYAILEEEFTNSKHDIEAIKSQLAEHSDKYEFKIKLLQQRLDSYNNKENCHSSAQVSIIADDLNIEKHENEKLKNTIDSLNNEMQVLSQKLADAEAQLSQMKLKIPLEKERETLIKSLQEKAAKFEDIIKEKQMKPDCLSVGVNTDSISMPEQADLLRTKYETDLVQKEIEIRSEVKRDFDLKLEKVQKDLSQKLYQLQEKNCENCKDLLINLKQLKIVTDTREEEIDVLKQQMKQDREAVVSLLEEWSGKFIQMEAEKQELYKECTSLKEASDQLILKLRTKEAGDMKIYEVIKKECEETIKMWNKNTLDGLHRYALAQQANIKESKKRIEDFCSIADVEVQTVEAQYLKKIQLLQQNMTQKRNFKYRT
ncbi:hypothetical protein Trydic_g11549 [Trypoxylus dichotomus]